MIRAIAGGSFESEWRNIAPSLERVLTRYGVSHSLRDDVMQETALRLYRSWHRVDPDRPLLPLAVTIAKNVVWDERHRRSQVEVPGEVPDVAAEHDVEELGLARLELQRVRGLMDRLSASHRLVLLAEVGDADAPSGGSDATKMLRLRARKKMRALMEAATAGSFVARLPKELWRVVRGSRRPALSGAGPVAVATACGIVALLGVPPAFLEPQDLRRGAASRQVAVGERERLSSGERAASPGRGSRSGGAPERTQQEKSVATRPENTTYWHVGVGDEEAPVEGDARLGIRPDPSAEISEPTCATDTSESSEVAARCRADLGDRQVSVGAKVEVRPQP